MLIVMRTTATPQEIENIISRIEALGLHAHVSKGEERTVIGAVGEGTEAIKHQHVFSAMQGSTARCRFHAPTRWRRANSARRIPSSRWMG